MAVTTKELSREYLGRFHEFEHESVVAIRDTASGLKGFIAIHNTNLGPAVGGTRWWRYETEEDALRDALRLSRAMTYKCALANVPYGGAKAVLMRPDADEWAHEPYLEAYASALQEFAGRFFTGEDVGLTVDDLRFLAKRFKGGIIGDPDVSDLPGPWAARSVFISMKAALKETTGSGSLSGRTVAIKGIGHAGFELCKLVHADGGRLIAADINHARVKLAEENFDDISIVPSSAIASEAADVYAPCALGNEFNEETIPAIKAKIVCGAANNQLATPEDGKRLYERGILYVPDYIANAGGLIDVVDQLAPGGFDRERVALKVDGVAQTAAAVIRESRATRMPTNEVADTIGRQRFSRVHQRVLTV